MGLTHVTIEVGNPADAARWESVECLVDSGAIYSVVPSAVLERLGVEPRGDQEFRLADGSRMRRRKGIAAFRLPGREGDGGADVIFGEPGDANLLGAFTLEALGLGLDPLRRELLELPLIIGGAGSQS
jgi:hypothetical protein